MYDLFRLTKPLGNLVNDYSYAENSAYRFNQKYIFNANSKLYSLVVTIINLDGTGTAVDPQNILELNLVNEINNLCPVANLTVADPVGRVGEQYGKYFTHVQVCLKTYVNVSDDEFQGVEKPESTFLHTYIVENCELVRIDNAVGYRFKLKSVLWYNLAGYVKYSTFGKSDIPPILDVIRQCLHLAFSKSDNLLQLIKSETNSSGGSSVVNDMSFDRIISDTEKLKENYITACNTNIFEVFSYLTSKFYYDITDEDMKEFIIQPGLIYFVFDMMNAQYNVIKHGDQETYLKNSKNPFTWIALRRKTFSEELANQNQPMFGSAVGENATSIYQNLTFDKMLHKYDAKNGIYRNISIESNTLLDSLNADAQQPDELLKIQPADTIEMTESSGTAVSEIINAFNKLVETIIKPKANAEMFDNIYHYSDSTPNNPQIYQTMMNALLYKDALIMISGGEITHQPGTYFMINLDNAIPIDVNTDSKIVETYKTCNLQFQGIFNVVKVTHTIRPGAKDPGSRFVESIVLNKLSYPKKETFSSKEA